ncbi:DUF397 domain-containing protein [Streptomyces sp. NPDC003077]|uniref:DUF397 domain-containing protein n=1 Tax=Streptomyces sp. NPDC003077 TaxID=3154443 RepID=UPI0033B2DEDA
MCGLVWQKSSFSEGHTEACVEVVADSAEAYLRESDAPTTILTTTPTALRGLVRAVKENHLGRLTRNP